MTEQSRMEISMAAEPASVRFARSELMRWFHEQGRSDDGLAASIALAVSEAVANVVRHAYPGDAGRVEVEAELRESHILVAVSDRGTGLEARPARDSNGMGLPVIGRVADGVTVESSAGGTTVSMRFDVTSPSGRRPLLRQTLSGSYAVTAH